MRPRIPFPEVLSNETTSVCGCAMVVTILSLFTKTYTVKLPGWFILLVIALLLVLILD
jgi:hypothetical protein